MKASTLAAGAGGFVGAPVAAGLVVAISAASPTQETPSPAALAPRALGITAATAVASAVAARFVKGEALRVALYAGAAGSAASALLWWRYLGEQPAAAAPQPALTEWRAIEGAEIPLRKGERYRGAIDLPWGAGFLVTESAAEAKARELGFRDVRAFKERPAGWAEAEDVDLYVEATWDGADGERMQRPDRLVGAWQRS